MKHRILFILFLIIQASAFAQISCTISPADTTVCFRDSMAIRAVVTGSASTPSYQWFKNGVEIPFADDTILVLRAVTYADTAVYTCVVGSGIDFDTSNTATVHVRPAIIVDTLYRFNALGCFSDCKGQFYVHISGGVPPYTYNWGGGFSQDTIVYGLCPGELVLTVTDFNGCFIDTTYLVDYLKSPKVDFTRLPGDTIYLTNPNLTVEYPDSMRQYMTNWEWDFGDTTDAVVNLNPGTHTYQRNQTYPVRLRLTDLNGCDTTITHDIIVKIAELQIAGVMTPNGDGKNDKFKIQIKGNSEVDYRLAYLSTELLVFDRWGRKVFHKTNYESDTWDADNLPDGVYFWVLKCQGQFGEDDFRGSLTILGRDMSGQ